MFVVTLNIFGLLFEHQFLQLLEVKLKFGTEIIVFSVFLAQDRAKIGSPINFDKYYF